MFRLSNWELSTTEVAELNNPKGKMGALNSTECGRGSLGVSKRNVACHRANVGLVVS
jgi:hypothetical protein